MDVVDIWVNLVTEQTANAFLGQAENAHIPGYLGSNQGPLDVNELVALMDELGVATGIFTGASTATPTRCSRRATRTPDGSSLPAASATRRARAAPCVASASSRSTRASRWCA